MQINLLWEGIAYHSLENCLIHIEEDAVNISSTIVGSFQEKMYRLNYEIRTNRHWETKYLGINSWVNQSYQLFQLSSESPGHWKLNGETDTRFNGCIDVDISLTPFTNTLPIRRLQMRENETEKLKLIYCDILENQVNTAFQQYTCLPRSFYHFENIPNDFEAEIEVDYQGLVVNYPELFRRIGVQFSQPKLPELI